MKKVIGKNQVIITSLAILIAVAGYLNFADVDLGFRDKEASTDSSSILEDAGYDLTDETALLDENQTDGGLTDNSFTDSQETDTPGEAVFTGATGFAAQAKISREQVRSQNKADLQDIINNEEIDDEEKQEAIHTMVSMTDLSEKEAAAELLLESKGFTDAVVSITDGSVDVVLPSDRAPKLWAVGGAIQPDGSAVVSVVLQGRGIVCGGSFTLTYDQSLSVQAEPSGTCQINAEPGKIRASFASATPVADQVSLLKLTIQNAVPGAIDLSNAIFRDDSRIAAADVRPTTLSYTTSAAAFAGTLRADTSAGQTQYLLDVDVSDMRAGTPEARTEFTCLLALYDSDGLMEGLSVQKIAASDTGVNELTLTTSASKTPAYAKVFLLSDASAGLPLCGALQAALERR